MQILYTVSSVNDGTKVMFYISVISERTRPSAGIVQN